MIGEASLLQSGWAVVRRNLRFVFWFWLLNLTLAQFGASAFRGHAHAILDNSLYADKLLHGFNPLVLGELLARPESGPLNASTNPAYFFGLLFVVATLLLMPGVLRQYTAEHRVSRDEFFRTCGHNLWRFMRLVLI